MMPPPRISMRLGTLQVQRAGGVDHARVLGHEGQAHGLAAGGDDGALELHDLLAAGLFLAVAGGFFHLDVVGADEVAVAAHDGDLAHLGHLAQAAGQLADDLVLVAAQLVDVDLGRAELDACHFQVLDLVHHGRHVQQRLGGMQPTFRQTPPRVVALDQTTFRPRSAARKAAE
jgi:hypothetical protein